MQKSGYKDTIKTLEMKKTIILLSILLNIFNSFSQEKEETSKHLTFKGIPLDGPLDEYVLKMKQNGFRHLNTKDGVATLQGDFAGYKDCYIGVSTLNQKGLVYKIGVLFPDKDTWSTLSDNYFTLKALLNEKYGEPSDMVEKFDKATTESKDDGTKMFEVKFDRCKYYSIWETEKGKIQLSIGHDSVTSCFVKLGYFDKINSATVKKQALDDL